jgi:hypothetical protein
MAKKKFKRVKFIEVSVHCVVHDYDNYPAYTNKRLYLKQYNFSRRLKNVDDADKFIVNLKKLSKLKIKK